MVKTSDNTLFFTILEMIISSIAEENKYNEAVLNLFLVLFLSCCVTVYQKSTDQLSLVEGRFVAGLVAPHLSAHLLFTNLEVGDCEMKEP